jgi:hypothetical protein
MARLKLFYPKNEIEAGFYANPGEFILENGDEYIGPYCKADGVLVTGNKPTKSSRRLLSTDIQHLKEKNFTYFKLTKTAFDRHVTPKLYIPEPTNKDYVNGQFKRYFVQKINQSDYILEIDKQQYDDANDKNKPGINLKLYRKGIVEWMLTGADAAEINNKTLLLKERTYTTIRQYFSDFSEFVR